MDDNFILEHNVTQVRQNSLALCLNEGSSIQTIKKRKEKEMRSHVDFSVMISYFVTILTPFLYVMKVKAC